MKFAIAIAALVSSANAMKAMTENQIAQMSFDDQVNLINDVKAESTSLKLKIAQLKSKNAADTETMNGHITQCNTNLGQKTGELEALKGETWDDLLAHHVTDLKNHQDGLQGQYDEEEKRLNGLLQDEEDDLLIKQGETNTALTQKNAAIQRFEDANAEQLRLEGEHTTNVANLNSAQNAIYEPIEQARIEKSAEESELQGDHAENVTEISNKEGEKSAKTTTAANLLTDVNKLIADQEAAIAAHKSIMDPITAAIDTENKRHSGEVDRLNGLYADMVEKREREDPIAIQTEVDRLTAVRDEAVRSATAMDENTIYEVCTKIDNEGDGSLPVTINTVNSDDNDDSQVVA